MLRASSKVGVTAVYSSQHIITTRTRGNISPAQALFVVLSLQSMHPTETKKNGKQLNIQALCSVDLYKSAAQCSINILLTQTLQ